jgi:putative ABC transport system permease protein
VDALWQDLRYSIRTLVKSPTFTAVVLLTLALGIGANTAIFSVVYGVLLRPLPYPRPDQIVAAWEVSAEGRRMNFADPNFEDLRALNHSLQGLAEYASGLQSVSGGTEPTRTMVAAVSRDFFAVMGVQPLAGRTFVAEEQRERGAPAALVSYAYWRQYLGESPDLQGLKLKIDDRSCTVVGVLPPDFRFPSDASLWVARELSERLPSRTAHNWHVVGRLRDDVALGQARAELTVIARRLKQQHGQETAMVDAALSPLRDALVGRVRPALLMLLGAVGLLLLVACANVANLLLARAAGRGRELAVRAAVGATRGRLVRQFLAEALVLSVGGAVPGVLAALWGVDALVTLAPYDLPRMDEISVNPAVLLFAMGVSVLVAVVLGVFTAIRASSGDVRSTLVEGSRGQSPALSSQRLGRMIVAAQVAVTLVLLVGAGLLGRSLLRVLAVDPGIRTDHVLTMDLSLPQAGAETETSRARRVNFLDELFTRLRGIPGVQDVGGANEVPLSSDLSDGTFLVMRPGEKVLSLEDFERLVRDLSRTGDADYCVANDGYFRTLGIPLLRGRSFDERDAMDAPHVAVISASLAQARWPSEDPIGRLIEFGNMDGDLRVLTIVGVVGDVRERSLEAPPRPTVYVNYRQRPAATSRFVFVMRADADPAATVRAARGIVRDLAPDVPPHFRTYDQVVAASLGTRRFNLTLVVVFAVTALLLAVAGIYGVMAYSVVQRTHEIGIRMALAAAPRDVLVMILGQGMLTSAVGVAIGLVGAAVLTAAMESLLFGVSATDPATFAGVALLLVLVAVVACWVPARRAMRVDPIVALRYE